MIRSMTGFGRAKREFSAYTITVDIKSVNSRYFDCSVRMPRAYAYLEEKVKSYIQTGVIARGKVEVSISYDLKGSEAGVIHVNREGAAAYLAALRELRDTFGLKDDISTMALARNPDVFSYTKEDEDPEDAWANLMACVSGAGEEFSRMREAEGKRIESDVSGKLTAVAAWADQIEELSKSDVNCHKEKLEARIRQILSDQAVTVDENRLLTECAIWADKIAIDEELVRLRSHFGAFREICQEATPSGKKLDFLMQELNRETNTIGSKCSNAQIARLVVSMKNELEKIREQIQNVE